MGSGDQERLRAIVDQVVTESGYDLEELTVIAAGRRRLVRVVIDGDHGVDLDEAAEISRALSERLDGPPAGAPDQPADSADDPMGAAPYTLEVTSPGVGRPLTLPRHFRRAFGRLLSLTTVAGQQLQARVRAAGPDEVELLTGPAGTTPLSLRYDAIARAKVEVEFNPPSAAVLALLGRPVTPGVGGAANEPGADERDDEGPVDEDHDDQDHSDEDDEVEPR